MDAKVELGGKEHTASVGIAIGDAVRSIGYAPDAFIFMVNGRPVPMDMPVADGMIIKAIKVASGG
ncbi:MAG: hypothetical protein LBR42_01185 [Candidatus Methanoplasma sp.]|nr:hypothetical protein [Candidatus Methanoplasma sp.]